MNYRSLSLAALLFVLLGSLLALPVVHGLAPLPARGAAPPNPYSVQGTIYQPGGRLPAPGANVWVNDTTRGFSLTTTANATAQYQVDLSSGTPNYKNGDSISVTAMYLPYAGTNTTKVVTTRSGSYCNVSLAARPLSASLTPLPSTVYAGQVTTLWGAGAGGVQPYTYNWTFGDGTPHAATAANRTQHIYSAAGTYTAQLILNDSAANTATASATITVVAAPALALACAPAAPRVFTPVTFNGTLSVAGNGWSYFFNFGDGSNSGYTAPGTNGSIHGYSASGTYTANVTAWNVSTGFRVDSGPVIVTVAPRLGVALAATPSTTEVGYNTSFLATPSGAQSAVSYTFAYGDGMSSGPQASASALHAYASAANLTANVTATDTGGPAGTAFATSPVTVVKAVGVVLAPSVTSGSAPLTVTFVASPYAGVAPYKFNFTLGNGVVILGNATGHASATYTTPGTYTASVRVLDALGVHAWASVTITVSSTPPPLVISAYATPRTGAAPLHVSFGVWASGGVTPYTFAWVFGDGSASLAQRYANHTYTSAGTFTADVWVNDSSGLSQEQSFTLVVSVLQAQLYGPIALQVNSAGTYTVDNVTGGVGPYTVAWNFHDGSAWAHTQGTSSSIAHTFTAKGTYVITAYVNDSESPARSASENLTVVVSAASSPTSSPPSLVSQLMPGGSLFPLLLLLVLLLVVVLVVLAVARRRKRQREGEEAAVAAGLAAGTAVEAPSTAPEGEAAPEEGSGAADAEAGSEAAPEGEPLAEGEASEPSGEPTEGEAGNPVEIEEPQAEAPPEEGSTDEGSDPPEGGEQPPEEGAPSGEEAPPSEEEPSQEEGSPDEDSHGGSDA